MNSNNYNFNSDDEIPLDVLRVRFIHGRFKPTAGADAKAVVTDSAKKVINGFIAFSTFILAIISIFAPVWDSVGNSVRLYDYLLFGDESIVGNIISFFTEIDTMSVDYLYYYIIYLAISIVISIEGIALIIYAIRHGIGAVISFFKNETGKLELGLIKLFKRVLAFLFVTAVSRSSEYGSLACDVNPNLTYATMFSALVILGVGIARTVIRYKKSGIFNKNLKTYILKFAAGAAIVATVLSADLFDFAYYSVVGFINFLENIPYAFEEISIFVSFLVAVFIDLVFLKVMKIILERFNYDSLRLLTCEEELTADTRAYLLKDNLKKTSYILVVVVSVVSLALCADFLYEFVGAATNELFVANSNMFVWLLLVSLAAEVTSRIFAKKK